MEQTILSLRRLVERLKVENKNLKDGKGLNSSKPIGTKVSWCEFKVRFLSDK